MKELEKVYDPKQVEGQIYDEWLKRKYFHAVIDRSKKPYTIVIPPPNITGQLHMGHALDNTVQDILVRWRRMQGYCALWLPGTDHASIATEARIVEAMAKEGLSKEAIGREKFLERAWEWKRHFGGRITEQLKRLGSSCDWDRERFTLDEGLSKAVTEVFVRLFEKGLIYRGERIINWCPGCNTSISDAEVEYEEKEGSLWHIRYPLADGSGHVTVATTRPETMLGDTAVAVNPEDSRYRGLIGKMAVLPLMSREIPIITDDYVETGFGTGAVKITPAHDPNDFEIGLRHSLPQVKVIGSDAVMTVEAKQYAGLDRYEARHRIVEDLKQQGLLVKIDKHVHNVGACYRCGQTIEPMISKQWFVKMESLAGPAIDAVKEGKVTFVPERFSKIYFNWMENIRDWCISRQLWWGHRIPAYYCSACGETIVAREMPEKCPKCVASGHEASTGSAGRSDVINGNGAVNESSVVIKSGAIEINNAANESSDFSGSGTSIGRGAIVQDPDTLDTWFSSALWPFSTLGWPAKTEDLEYFYPTDVLVTAYDIIFFWVARMIFSGMEHMGREPFEYVFIHGLIRDSQGRKMSKSLGNGIDPLDIMDQYGTDALRFALTSGISPGNDQRFFTEKVESARNFANKVWNAARFALMNFDDEPDLSKADPARYTVADKWILSRLNRLSGEVTDNLEKFELGLALQKVYDFIWDELCDWYIELIKPRLYDRECESRLEAQQVLNCVLGGALKLLHPFMPFITEEIYRSLITCDESIMISEWPKLNASMDFPAEEEQMLMIMDVIKAVRNIRAEMDVSAAKRPNILIIPVGVDNANASAAVFENGKEFIRRLASAGNVIVSSDRSHIPQNSVSAVMASAEAYMPLDELIDIPKEIERLENELKGLQKELDRAAGLLANEGFLRKAPPKVIEEEKAKQAMYRDMYDRVEERIVWFRSRR